MRGTDEARIIHNHQLFSENYIPPNIPAREKQIKEIAFFLSTASNSINPINVWIYGLPGTGKTSICKFLLNKLEKETNVRGLYVNCWENPTFYTILDKIIRELRILGAEKLNTSFKFDRLRSHIKDRPFILFLDEIDQPSQKERNSILYNFSNLTRVGIVAICNSKYVLYMLDERIRSRLNVQWIEFEPYTADDIYSILCHRAEFALTSGSCDEHVLRRIADLSGQDARVAIQTLKNAAYLAENGIVKSITTLHANKGYCSVKGLKKSYLLDKLTVHHRILYDIIQHKGDVLSGRLWKFYIKNCAHMNIRPVAARTYSEYLRKLVEAELVRAERASIKGRVRHLSAV